MMARRYGYARPWTLALLTGLLLACSAGQSAAQEMLGGRWWKNDRVVQRIGLTAEEISSLDKAFRTSRRNLISLNGKVEVEQIELGLAEADAGDTVAHDEVVARWERKLADSLDAAGKP